MAQTRLLHNLHTSAIGNRLLLLFISFRKITNFPCVHPDDLNPAIQSSSAIFISTRAINVKNTLLAPSEINSFVPWIRTDDLEGAMYLPEDGMTDPTNTAMSLARGAKNRGKPTNISTR